MPRIQNSVIDELAMREAFPYERWVNLTYANTHSTSRQRRYFVNYIIYGRSTYEALSNYLFANGKFGSVAYDDAFVSDCFAAYWRGDKEDNCCRQSLGAFWRKVRGGCYVKEHSSGCTT